MKNQQSDRRKDRTVNRKSDRRENRTEDHGQWKRNRERALRVKGLIALCAFLALLFIYGMVSAHYVRTFLPGTRVNGISIAGLGEEAANRKLVQQMEENYSLTLQFRGEEVQTLTAQQISAEVNFGTQVWEHLTAQNPYSWPLHVFGLAQDPSDWSCTLMWDGAAAKSWLNSLPQMQTADMTMPVGAGMQFDETNNIVVKPEVNGNYLDADAVYLVMEEYLREGKQTLDLEEEGLYRAPDVTSDSEELDSQIQRMNQYLDTKVTLTMHDGQTVVVDASVIRDWFIEDAAHAGWYTMESQSLMDSITSYVASLAENYNMSYGRCDFQTTAEGIISLPVSSGSFGYMINQTAESEKLFQEVISGSVEERIPIYGVATPFSPDTWDTYVEVDTWQQKVYLYVAGEVTFTTDCVTGLSGDPDRETPGGIYALYDMEKDRTLEGTVEEDTGQPEYSSKVSYWMPFSGGYGLHDASWRNAFGGTIYQTNGSHGCVNLPVLAAKTIYEAVSIGTPVVIVA